MRSKKHWGSLAAGLFAGLLILPLGASAFADDPTPGSDQGGSPGPSAPADVKISTELPKEIKVSNSMGTTTLTAKILNKGTKDTGRITLTVLGLDGMRITGVPGCSPVPENKLPKGTNTGFACVIDNLAAGKDKSYAVSATYDLKKTGKICLPVTEGTGDTLLWQQGPVPFGTTRPTPNAPDTPLLLGTDNVPAAPPAGSASPSPTAPASPAPAAPGSPTPTPPAQLPRTGVNDGVLPLLAAGCLLLFVGSTGIWWANSRHHRRRLH
ncbi:hypothetical protein ACFWXK_32030 [Streptomyces sp. NPDC059070]|uniref:hypothetical protein n=1 Tax=unclassified Streptomyces TaxID=2593676 RepID=UPI0034E2E80A